MAELKRRSRFDDTEDRGRTRARKTRWGDKNDKANYPGLPTALPPNLTKDQLDSYVIHLRVEEISRKIRLGNYIPREKNSPSPEPVYDEEGRRTNTRDQRYRDKLEAQKTAMIEEAFRKIPGFRPPIDFKRAVKLQEKIYIPVKDFPEVNFIGLLIGPRGHTLKKLEADCGVKISIRGRGSVKEGKARADGSAAPGEDEDLHCLVMAEAELNLRAGVKMVNQIIETATSVPEGENPLKKNQLRELAALNGTLREEEAQMCTNCGGMGHRSWECTEARNFTTTLICKICNGIGHIARDCIQKNNPELILASQEKETHLEDEYATLMAELGNKTVQQQQAITANPWNAAPPSETPGPYQTPWNQPPPPPSIQ